MAISTRLHSVTMLRFFMVGIWMCPKFSIEKIAFSKKIGGVQIFSSNKLHLRKKKLWVSKIYEKICYFGKNLQVGTI